MNKKDYVIVLIKGQKVDETNFWAYVAIHPSKYADFKIAEADGSYVINDYGKIICHGAGKIPPDDVQKYMRDEYNFTDTLEEHLSDYLKK